MTMFSNFYDKLISNLYFKMSKFTRDNAPKINKILLIIFAPYYYIIELIIFKYFWEKIIIEEIFTNDEIIDFLDKNEFGFKNNIIYKSDLINSNEFYDSINLTEAKNIIEKEYVTEFYNLFHKNIMFNIEEYIIINVETELSIIRNHNDVYKERIYRIELFFNRYFYLQKQKQYFKNWIILISSVLILSILNKYLFHFYIL